MTPMNAFKAAQQHLPATDALNRTLSREMDKCQLPRPRQRRRVAASSPQNESTVTEHKISFDMSDLIDATQPLEETLSFPKIEWSLDDDDDDTDYLVHEIPLPDASKDWLHQSCSSPILGKRSRRDYHTSGLVRSKSLKSSLCYLVETEDPLQRLAVTTKDGSWGQFAVCELHEQSGSQRKMTV